MWPVNLDILDGCEDFLSGCLTFPAEVARQALMLSENMEEVVNRAEEKRGTTVH